MMKMSAVKATAMRVGIGLDRLVPVGQLCGLPHTMLDVTGFRARSSGWRKYKDTKDKDRSIIKK